MTVTEAPVAPSAVPPRKPRGGMQPGIPRCGAPTKHMGRPCKAYAGAGTPHFGAGRCVWHEPDRPTGDRRITHLQLKREAARYGDQLDVNPYQTLIDNLRHTAGHVAWLRGKIRKVESDDKLLRGAGRQLLGDYREERKLLAHYAKLAIDAQLMEKIVHIAERDGELLAQCAITALTRVGINDELQKRVLNEMAIEVRAVQYATVERGVVKRRAIDTTEAVKAPDVSPDNLTRWADTDDHATPQDEATPEDDLHARWWERSDSERAKRRAPTSPVAQPPPPDPADDRYDPVRRSPDAIVSEWWERVGL
jgi:hypothetical protein